MSQTERLMAIIGKLCQRNGRVNTSWIVNRFEISDRQARRDMEFIRDRIVDQYLASEVDLIYDRGRNEYRFDGSSERIEQLFAKSAISAAVSSSAIDPIRELVGSKTDSSKSSNVRFISQASELPDYRIFVDILNAIDESVRIRIRYKNLDQVDTERLIEPFELINYSAIWYVRAYDVSKEDLRTFSLSRIRSVSFTSEKREFADYEKRKKDDMDEYGIFFGGKKEIYTIRFYNLVAWIVSNQIWHTHQVGRWIDENTYELDIPASNPTELVAKTLSYGADAEPISPESFVDSYNNELVALFRKNKNKLESI